MIQYHIPPQIDQKPDKSELSPSLGHHPPPHPGLRSPLNNGQHTPDKKPWPVTPPMVPTPLLPLPTLSFTVSQVMWTMLLAATAALEIYSYSCILKLQNVKFFNKT